MIQHLLLVGAGGSLGSMARYFIQQWIQKNYAHYFPWGTFIVNITGCLLIGIFYAISLKPADVAANSISNEWKLFLMTGICGGFTTFSAFTLEGFGLLRENKTGLFFAYTTASVMLGLLATYAGIKLIR